MGVRGARAITIAGGRWRGRTLTYPETGPIRPTMQRTRLSLFSSLGESVEGAVFADLYAGAGVVGIEALSRGARHVHFVEWNRPALAALAANLAACAVDRGCYSIHAAAVQAVLDASPCVLRDSRVAFADPPYDANAQDELLSRLRASEFGELETLVVEHRTKVELTAPAGLRIDRARRFGDTTLTYFVPAGDAG